MAIMLKKRSKVFINAWNKVSSEDISFDEALATAWEEYRLQKLIAVLHSGMATVTYRTHSGQLLTRLATRNSEFIPSGKQPKQPAKESEYIAAVPYYSLTDQCWKMIEAQHLLTFQPVKIERNEQCSRIQTIAA